MELQCYNPKCLHLWNYKGKSSNDKDTLTCPKCLNKLRLGKAKLGNLPNEKQKKKQELGNLPNPYKKTLKVPETNSVEENLEDEIRLTNPLHANPVNIEHIKKYPKEKPKIKEHKKVEDHLVSFEEIKSDIELKQIPFKK